MEKYACKKYITTPDKALKKLKKYGVAIIPSILNDKECKEMQNGMWDTLEHISQKWDQPINRNNRETWRNVRHLYPKHGMLIQNFGIGHAQFIWNLRMKEKIVDIFSKIWKCKKEELLTSFDATSFHLPSEVTNIGWHRNDWYHTDQSFTRNDFECIQSWVTGFDVNKGDATLGFLEKSHKFHKNFREDHMIIDKSDWYKLSEEETNYFYNKGCIEKKIYCPKGSLVLWDSRTIHCGVGPLKERNSSNFRCVVYLCYTPKSKANKKVFDKRIKAFEELRMTSHWPHKPKLFAKNPRTYGNELKIMTPFNKPKINDLGKSLVGYTIKNNNVII